MKPLKIILIILLVISFAIANMAFENQIKSDQEKIKDIFNQGRKQIYAKKWPEAITHFKTIIKSHPESKYADDSLYWLAYGLKKHSQKQKNDKKEISLLTEAFAQLQPLIEKYPDSRWVDDAELLKVEIAELLVEKGKEDYEKYILDHASKEIEWEDMEALESLEALKGLESLPEVLDRIKDVSKDLQKIDGIEIAVKNLEGVKGQIPNGIEIATQVLKNLQDLPGITEALGKLESVKQINGIEEAINSLKAVQNLKELKNIQGLSKLEGYEEAARALESLKGLKDVEQNLHKLEQLQQLEELEALAEEKKLLALEKEEALAALKSVKKIQHSLQNLKGLEELSKHQDIKALKELDFEDVLEDMEFEADLKLVALNSLLQRDQGKAVQILQKMLKENQSPKFREKAVLILAQINDPLAGQILTDIAKNEKENEAVREKALLWLHNKKNGDTVKKLAEIYQQSNSIQFKKSILHTLSRHNNDKAVKSLIEIYKKEQNVYLKKTIIKLLGKTENKRAQKFIQSLLEE